MKKANLIRLKAGGIIVSITFTIFVLVVLSAKYLMGFAWPQILARAPVTVAVVLAADLGGFLLVWFKTSPWLSFYETLERGEKIPPELFKKSFELAYGFPAAAGLNAFWFSLLTVAVVGLDLAFFAGRSMTDALHLLVPTFVYYLVGGVIVFFWTKLVVREVARDLAALDPEIYRGRFDRTYPFPVAFLVFWRVRKEWKLSIRSKIFMVMVFVGLLGVVFFYMAIREFGADMAGGLTVAESVSLRNFFVALLVFQVVVGVGVAFLLSYFVSRDLKDPVDEMIRASDSVTGGDYRDRSRVVTEDELCVVSASINRTTEELVTGLELRIESLESVMEGAERVAERIQAVSESILKVMSELASGASLQRSGVEEATRSSGQLGRSSEIISRAARQIETLSIGALSSCEKGQLTVQEMVNTMDRLRQQIHQSANEMDNLLDLARKIRGVVELIDEISDQINLVSLNASLEAAGAGEAGRRFNAVAEEITRLAQRTMQSTEQVNRLIGSVIKAAEQVASFTNTGRGSVDKSVMSMEEVGVFLVMLMEQVEQVSKHVMGITGSTEEQTSSTLALSERLSGIEGAALRVESHVGEVQASLTELDRIAYDLITRVSKSRDKTETGAGY